MSGLRILGLPAAGSPLEYRGVDRPVPNEVRGGQADHPAQRAFAWYAAHVRQDLTVDDIEAAAKLVRAYALLDPPQLFQVVEVTAEDEAPSEGSVLGYDIAAGSYSLLSWGAALGTPPKAVLAKDDRYHALRPLLRTAGAYYQQFLGPKGIFENARVAAECLEVLLAAQAIRPGLWEDATEQFEVVRVVAIINPDL